MRLSFFASVALAMLVLVPAAHAQLNGFYTIGGTSPDYATLADAVADLNAQGVSGPTRFAIRAGTYTEQVSIGPIAGVSAADTVQFRAANPSARPVIQFDATAGANYVIRLQGADHVKFRNLDFVETGTDPNARLLVIEGDADDVSVDGCTFTGLAAASSSDGSLLYAGGTLADRLKVAGSTFEGGYRGLDLAGSSSPRSSGLRATRNTFNNQSDGAVNVYGRDDAVVDGNTITAGASASGTFTGLLFQFSEGEVTRNTIGATYRALFVNSGAEALVANNFIVANLPSTFSRAVNLTGGGTVRFYHNSVYAYGAAGAALWVFSGSSGADNIELLDNLLIHGGNGPALDVDVNGVLGVSNYNDLYTSGATLVSYNGTPYADLAAYQAGTGLDGFSVSKAVTFVDAPGGDLHVAGASDGDMDLAGTPLAEVPTDIDGETRGAPPYMGADEASPLAPPPNYDLQATATSPLTVPAGGQVSFAYAVTNNTASTASGDLYFTASGGYQGVIVSGSLPSGQTYNGTYVQNIPGNAPPGTYTYRMKVGSFPNVAVDEEAFQITVTAPRQAAGEGSWTVADATPWPAPEAAAASAPPETFALHAAAPNPFAGRTALRYDLPEAADVRVVVYDLLGREVAVLVDGAAEAGAHAVTLDGAALPSGVYLVRMTAGAFAATARVTLVR